MIKTGIKFITLFIYFTRDKFRYFDFTQRRQERQENKSFASFAASHKNVRFYSILSIIIILNTSFLNSNYENKPNDFKKKPPFVKTKSTWVDSVYNSLTDDEKIAQLFMVAAYSNKDTNHVNKISNLIKKYKIGGLIFFQGGPVRQAKLTNYYQSISKTPLMIATDAEWGLAMRLDSTIRFPRQMTLGAIQDNSLIYEMGETIAQQCKRLNINVNFAPVIDINSNPNNPVINSRSFGEDRQNVAYKGLAYMMGLQDNNILATGKHFRVMAIQIQILTKLCLL